MNYFFFAGIDISKGWFDVTLRRPQNLKFAPHERFDNNAKGFSKMFEWLNEQLQSDMSTLLICMEHTGVYTIPLCEFLGEKELSYTLIAGAQIAASVGIKRGKSDKTDSRQIADYALKNREEIRIHTLPGKTIRTLKHLLALRSRLMKAKHRFTVSAKELKAFEADEICEHIVASSQKMMVCILQQLKEVAQKIRACLKSNEELHKNYKLLCSVPGIGDQTALYILVTTKNFVSFTCAKKYASYAGIAPFSSNSGSSVRSTTRVSQKANKKIKSLLSSGVSSSLNRCPEYRLYYEKQLEKGKNENSIKNVIRNKIVTRAFAVIRRKQAYVDLHSFAS